VCLSRPLYGPGPSLSLSHPGQEVRVDAPLEGRRDVPELVVQCLEFQKVSPYIHQRLQAGGDTACRTTHSAHFRGVGVTVYRSAVSFWLELSAAVLSVRLGPTP
jgi:hypothetical protein